MCQTRTKVLAYALVTSLIIILLTGCWDYRGLDKQSFVTGLAIDRNPKTGLYQVTFEVLDLTQNVKQQGAQTFLLESEGRTIFDAVRNANVKIENRLYFGDTEVVIIGRELAEKEGVFSIVEWFLRDNETRENVNIIISRAKNAKDIFKHKLRDNSIVSYELYEVITKDSQVLASTQEGRIYQVYNWFNEEGAELVLPAADLIKQNEEKMTAAINGVMIFRGDKVIGDLNALETKYFLFITDQIKGCLLTFSSSGGEEDDVTLEVFESKTKRTYQFEDGRVNVKLRIKTKAFIGEVMRESDLLEKEELEKIKQAAEEKIRTKLAETVRMVQREYNVDIFGFGKMVHQKDKELWHELGPEWDRYFRDLSIEVESEVEIINSAHLKSTERR